MGTHKFFIFGTCFNPNVETLNKTFIVLMGFWDPKVVISCFFYFNPWKLVEICPLNREKEPKLLTSYYLLPTMSHQVFLGPAKTLVTVDREGKQILK